MRQILGQGFMCLQFIKEVLPGATSKRRKETGQGREEAKPGAISVQVPQGVASA